MLRSRSEQIQFCQQTTARLKTSQESFLVKLKKGEKAQVAAGQPPRLRSEPEEYVHVLNLWVRIRKDAGPSWPLQLAPESRPSKEILHDLGVLLADLAESNHPAASPGEAHLAMLAGASALGCDASTISLTRWWNSRFPQTDMALSNLFRPAAARFREILNKGNHPYALTVEALRLVNTGKPQAALRFVNRVAQVTDVESFPWRDLLESCQSKSQLQREDKSAALEAARDPSQQRSQAAMETLMRHSPLAAERRRAAERHFMIEPNLVSLRFLAEDDVASEPVVGDAQQAEDIIQKEWKLLYKTMTEESKEAER
ncbi:uncharacterized protein J7T54_002431 [Emericellopsis cladophorae]|uniref:Uncharacterized protein n=1 Tax=Emericellopsis cladophorae TaxID=2686198 RepID=A0A9Q0BFE1_9HYPO|nr:uncharacterized protein J7T54_002431 [Emericellopsis cladophorae]KAI6782194.1 hypothetical protein J7T54_002431 [Emericellopsis cladophorae]